MSAVFFARREPHSVTVTKQMNSIAPKPYIGMPSGGNDSLKNGSVNRTCCIAASGGKFEIRKTKSERKTMSEPKHDCREPGFISNFVLRISKFSQSGYGQPIQYLLNQ